MEGPSIYLAAEQLAPFIGKRVMRVNGNTKKIAKERLLGEQIIDIFSHGKHLYFQCNNFALKVHFLLYGSFEAIVDDNKVTGDYPRKKREPRLSLFFTNGDAALYSCSVHYIEQAHAKDLCDYTTDIMSSSFDKNKALQALKNEPEQEIADVLLDQSIFGGVGNIIKNEVLLRAHIAPTRRVGEISLAKLKLVIDLTKDYVKDFYTWRKAFELKQHYQIYRQSICKICSTKVHRVRTGGRMRISYICQNCQQ